MLFPFLAMLVIVLLLPASAPLMAMFMLGNIFRESKVMERLKHAAHNELMNIGATMNAEQSHRPT
jgi:oxaloacetate decarboxylase beta subunit